jgi:hypothetical protein
MPAKIYEIAGVLRFFKMDKKNSDVLVVYIL